MAFESQVEVEVDARQTSTMLKRLLFILLKSEYNEYNKENNFIYQHNLIMCEICRLFGSLASWLYKYKEVDKLGDFSDNNQTNMSVGNTQDMSVGSSGDISLYKNHKLELLNKIFLYILKSIRNLQLLFYATSALR